MKFPREGCEQLITQLLGFGVEKHDDAVDALIYLILGLVGEEIAPQEVHYLCDRPVRTAVMVGAGVWTPVCATISWRGRRPGRLMSDGGVMLLALADRRLGVAEKLARVFPDGRDQSHRAVRTPARAGGEEMVQCNCPE